VVLRPHRTRRWEDIGTIPIGPYACRKWGLVCSVTGTLTPDATCNYTFEGSWDGRDYFRRSDGSYYIWWSSIDNAYVISAGVGSKGPTYWTGDQPALPGTYTPGGTATGNATVALGEHP